jgi:hypothetical protein
MSSSNPHHVDGDEYDYEDDSPPQSPRLASAAAAPAQPPDTLVVAPTGVADWRTGTDT